MKCSRCLDEKPAETFPYHDRLGARGPWCEECCGEHADTTRPDWDEIHALWRRHYARLYMRQKRGATRRRVRLRVVGAGWTLRLSALVGEPTTVRVGGPSEWLVRAREVMLEVMGVDPVDVTERGRGGGKGVRRQPHWDVIAEMTEEEWDTGLAKLKERFTVLEG